MDLNELVLRLAGQPLGEIRYYASTGSTNDEAARWAEQGAPDLSLVVADEQLTGRGRAGRQWFTPPGAALAFSLVLRLPQPEDPQRLLSRLTALGALAVSDALVHSYALPVEIKWPNDILIRRRKVGGVLSEAHWQGERLGAVILGIGVNVSLEAVPPAKDLIYPATCVTAETPDPVDRGQLLSTILSHVLQRKQDLETPGFIQDWQDRLAFQGDWVQIFQPGRSSEGRVLGLNPDGSLRLLDRSGREIAIYNGDLRLRPYE